MKKRVLALLLTAAMVVGLVGCGGSKEDTTKNDVAESTPAVEETEEVVELGYPIENAQGLSIFNIGMSIPSNQTNWEDVPFWQGLQENTGVKLDVQFPAEGADWNQTFNLLLTDEVLPDVIFKYTDANEIETLIADGVIYDLTEYLPKYAPDYWEFLNSEEYSSVKRDVTTASGKIGCFMSARENLYGVCYVGPVVRYDWLKECGLDEPVTVEDWEEMLVAFKEKYNATLGFTLAYFSGDANKGIASGFDAYGSLSPAYYVDDNGTIQFAQAQPEWLEMMTTLNKWYEMGLIDSDVLTMDNDVMRSKVLNNEIGAAFTAMSQITNWTADAEAENSGAEWGGVSYLRTAPGEPTSAIRATASLTQSFGAMITTSCSEEKLIEALRFLNYGYTEEGYMYWNFGTEGVSYTIDSDGHPQFTELLTEDPNGLDTAVHNYSGTAGAGIAVQAADMVRAKNVKVAGDAVDKWIENTKAQEYCLPKLALDEATTTEVNDLLNAVNTRCQEVTYKYLTGEKSMDDYNAFIEELNEMGVTRILEIYQEAYDAQYK